MISSSYRNELWNRMTGPWDIIVIGGGITGAGILREAARLGLHALLVEQRDFAWGSSSRSSKYVHGGLRYLATGQVHLTQIAVQERERLIAEGPGLVDPLGFLLAVYKGERPSSLIYRIVLAVYDLLGRQWTHRHYDAAEFELLAPYITRIGLQGGFRCRDAITDDARLVLRVLQEAVAAGGTALNYVTAEGLLRSGVSVRGVQVRDRVTGQTAEATARVVINATGAWADHLRGVVGARPRIRPLRGSHLVFPAWRVPVAQAVSFLHPIDKRHVSITPWEGATVFGTTDVDHDHSLDEEPRISPEEVAYLMAAVDSQFPSLDLGLDDIISTYAGVRPVIGTNEADPTKEVRDHVVWEEAGLLTVTGGKLTTFRRMAVDALKRVRHRLPDMPEPGAQLSALDRIAPVQVPMAGLDETRRERLLGRYGARSRDVSGGASIDELATIPGTHTLWAELRWAARAEAVLHLDDLLLRRTRLGLLLPCGAEAILPRVRAMCQPELGWDDARWDAEVTAYRALWQSCHSQPDRSTIPDWRPALAEAQARRAVHHSRRNPAHTGDQT